MQINPLPEPEDMEKLAKFMTAKLAEFEDIYEYPATPELYRKVLSTTQARLLAYNKRRPNEIEMLL